MIKSSLLVAVVITSIVTGELVSHAAAPSPYGQRQYYSSWSYYGDTGYYYSRYNFSSVNINVNVNVNVNYDTHFAICYPSRPRYVYYYNVRTRQYWGRFDREGEPGKQYSLLKQEDRKSNLKEIPEEAFPEPGKMPPIPGSEDGEAMIPPPPAPEAPDNPPADAPKQ